MNGSGDSAAVDRDSLDSLRALEKRVTAIDKRRGAQMNAALERLGACEQRATDAYTALHATREALEALGARVTDAEQRAAAAEREALAAADAAAAAGKAAGDAAAAASDTATSVGEVATRAAEAALETRSSALDARISDVDARLNNVHANLRDRKPPSVERLERVVAAQVALLRGETAYARAALHELAPVKPLSSPPPPPPPPALGTDDFPSPGVTATAIVTVECHSFHDWQVCNDV